MLDNVLIDCYAPIIGPHALTVYCFMARYQTRDGRVWREHRTMANAVGLSRPTIAKAVGRLFTTGLIVLFSPLIKRQDGKWRRLQNYSYRLVPLHVPVGGINPVGPANDVDQNNAAKHTAPDENHAEKTPMSTPLTPPANEIDPTGQRGLPVPANDVDQNKTQGKRESPNGESNHIRALTSVRASKSSSWYDDPEPGAKDVEQAIYYSLDPDRGDRIGELLTEPERDAVRDTAAKILERVGPNNPTNIAMVTAIMFRRDNPSGQVTAAGMRPYIEQSVRRILPGLAAANA